MKQVYCDNASTSFPKAPGLGEVIGKHIDTNGVNISRGGYTKAYTLEGEVVETREMLCELFGFNIAKNVVFTPGATWGMNMVLCGLLRSGEHVISSSMEHNAVARPLSELCKKGVQWSKAPAYKSGYLHAADVKKLIRPNTRIVIMTHASNVCGAISNIKEVGEVCKEQGVFFVVDGAQTAGSESINMQAQHIDGLVFPAHKCLMGPQGLGGIVLSERLAQSIDPIIAGGTGSISDKEIMPDFMPDKFQPGTMNIPGIIGLKHSLAFIKKEGLAAIGEKKRHLTSLFIDNMKNLSGADIIGPQDTQNRCSVVSLNFPHTDNAEMSFILEREYGISSRCGLHCAPLAHKTLGTYPHGTVRFSFGYFNTPEDISYVSHCIHKAIKNS